MGVLFGDGIVLYEIKSGSQLDWLLMYIPKCLSFLGCRKRVGVGGGVREKRRGSQEHLYKTVGREIKLKKVHFCITFSIVRAQMAG